QKVKISFMLIFSFLFSVNLFSQDSQHVHDDVYLELKNQRVEQIIDSFEFDSSFQAEFHARYRFAYQSFISVNSYYVQFFKRFIADEFSVVEQINFQNVRSRYLSLIDEFAVKDELWFEIPANHGVDVFYYAKHVFNPMRLDEDEERPVNNPKTLLCENAGFENNNWSGWSLYCATANNTNLSYSNPIQYTPPASCSSPANTPQQHALFSGGNDPYGNFPCVYEGGYSARLGNGAQANNPAHQAAVMRKTFVVDPVNNM